MNTIWESEKEGFLISTEREKIDVEFVHQYLSGKSYWASHIPLETVQKSIAGSLCFGIYEGKSQVGFARVITDQATYGYLADVFITNDYRGRGLGTWLIESIMSHPALQGFRTWQLATRDAHGLYAKFGFRPLEDPGLIMSIRDPEIYTKRPI
jgi:GNAT superfamily N-acetyltransferase